MGIELVLSVTSWSDFDRPFIPTYGYKISDCCGAFESGKEYRAVVHQRIFQCGNAMAESLDITVYNGSEDGWGDPDGRSYTSFTEFNADWKVLTTRQA